MPVINIFMNVVQAHWGQFILIALISLVAYVLILRRHFYSLFDPMVYAIFAVSMSTSVVVMMYLYHMTTGTLMANYMYTQVAYIIGLLLTRPVKKQATLLTVSRDSEDGREFIQTLYYVSVITLVIFQSFTYMTVGIPLFAASKYTLFSGGYGVLHRALEVLYFVVPYCLFVRVFLSRARRISAKVTDALVMVLLLVSMVLDGSKSTFIYIIFAAAIFSFYLNKLQDIGSDRKAKIQTSITRISYVLLVLCIVGAFVVIEAKSSGFVPALHELTKRVALYGDSYVYVFGINILPTLQSQGHGLTPLVAMFSDTLGMFRLIPWNALPKPLGFQIMHQAFSYYGVHYDASMGGPNARAGVFGLVYFGYWGSVVYSFILGFVTNLIRNRLYRMAPANHVWAIIYMLLTMAMTWSVTDVSLTDYLIDSSIIVLIPLLLLSFILVRYRSRRQKRLLRSMG